jgi:hypothetical protein
VQGGHRAKKALTTRGAARHSGVERVGEAAAEAAVPVIVVPPGGTLQVVVDVGPMVFPYTVAYAEHTLIKSLVDRAEPVPLRSGYTLLSWAFAHGAKGWSHSIGHSINGGPVQVLEKRSEANKDPDTKVGFALVKA